MKTKILTAEYKLIREGEHTKMEIIKPLLNVVEDFIKDLPSSDNVTQITVHNDQCLILYKKRLIQTGFLRK